MSSTCGRLLLTLWAAALLPGLFPACAEPEAQPDAPAQLTVSGEARLRYETLDGQFRAGGSGSDQLLLMRTLVLTEADFGPVDFGLELQDSRTYLGDEGTPLGTSVTNPLDVLQAYVRLSDLPGLSGAGSVTELTLGRQTVSIGSRRQIERVEFANALYSYTGAHLVSKSASGDRLHAFYVVPLARFPATGEALFDNQISGDEEQWQRRIWGVHFMDADGLGGLVSGLSYEVFVYGFDESDTAAFQTADRSHIAPGFRLTRAKEPGQMDLDLEAALRKGTRYATSNPADTDALKVDASMLFVSAGYTFRSPWQPRLAAEYYFASGDKDPGDATFGQHERLFGSRRTDLNNTSIHGPLTPANISAPGLRLEVEPDSRTDAWLKYSAVWLASATDSWVVARLRDPSGRSGDFVGHAIDGRVRYWLLPNRLRLEAGASLLEYGEFARNVPGGPDGDRTLFGYSQITYQF